MKTKKNETQHKNSLEIYLELYRQIENETNHQIEQFGLLLSQRISKKEEYTEKLTQLEKKGALIRNNKKSVISNGKISSACKACQTGKGSYTSFISLKCHRDCYFCFNKNQDEYSFYSHQLKNAYHELIEMYHNNVHLTHIALTGGEPLLHPKETVQFFSVANEKFPTSHTRLYTTGDLLTRQLLEDLQSVNLDEIRFSIKLEDSKQKQKHILSQIALAVQYIPEVMVEMPVIPGTEEGMKQLLLDLDEIGIFGINLLEFCFPFHNAESFEEKGLVLKNPPYDVYYNFWYAGGLAIDESEAICLELIDFAMEQQLQMGVHYCSLENKFTGQIYQQNHDANLDEMYSFSTRDYYFKTAKAFDRDMKKVIKAMNQFNFPYLINEEYQYVQFPIEAIPYLKNKNLDFLISFNVVENRNGEQAIREVYLEKTNSNCYLNSETLDVVN